jgi:hypothetical protein
MMWKVKRDLLFIVWRDYMEEIEIEVDKLISYIKGNPKTNNNENDPIFKRYKDFKDEIEKAKEE